MGARWEFGRGSSAQAGGKVGQCEIGGTRLYWAVAPAKVADDAGMAAAASEAAKEDPEVEREIEALAWVRTFELPTFRALTIIA